LLVTPLYFVLIFFSLFRRHRDANGAEIAAAIDMAHASGAAAPERSGVTDALR